MNFLDRFLDTKLKRTTTLFIFALINILIIALANFHLGTTLASFTDLNDFFDLIINPAVTNTFIGRLILLGLDWRNSFSDYFQFFFGALGLKQWLIIISSIIIFTASGQELLFRKLKQLLLLFWLVVLVQYVALAIIIWLLTSTINVGLVINLMGYMGLVLRISSLISALWALICLVVIIQYFIAME